MPFPDITHVSPGQSSNSIIVPEFTVDYLYFVFGPRYPAQPEIQFLNVA